MKRAALSFSLLAMLASPAFACRMADIPDERAAEQAASIYRGIVSGVYLPTLESNPPPMRSDQVAEPTFRVSPRIVRVVVGETLKGEHKSSLEFSLNWCGGGYAEIGDYVTVYHQPTHKLEWIVRRDADSDR